MALHDVTDQGSPSKYREVVDADGITHRRLRLNDDATVRVNLDAVGFALPGHSGTSIDGVDVGGVTQGVTIEAMVGKATKITLHMNALPVEIEAIGVVELDITDAKVG